MSTFIHTFYYFSSFFLLEPLSIRTFFLSQTYIHIIVKIEQRHFLCLAKRRNLPLARIENLIFLHEKISSNLSSNLSKLVRLFFFFLFLFLLVKIFLLLKLATEVKKKYPPPLFPYPIQVKWSFPYLPFLFDLKLASLMNRQRLH